MIAMFLILLLVVVAIGSLTLYAVRGLRCQLTSLRGEIADSHASVPAARAVPSVEIRAAVGEALADERERELAEARAFWAAQDARESGDTQFYDVIGGLGTDPDEFEIAPSLPRQADLSGLDDDGAAYHPSDPVFAPTASAVADQDQTATRLEDLAAGRVPLSDVRPGPRGTLDVYVFADGTTLCMTPGQRETALQLADALDRGETPFLLGGSAVAGAYSLTFTYGGESVFILADRVVSSL